jgi:ParB family transcriptional regulator, chromosome partitioning protein
VKRTKVRAKKEYIQHTDLRKYGFPEFRYYTDSTLEHEDQWRQLYLRGYLDMTDESRQEEDEVKTDAKSGADILESRTPPESLVNGPNSKEISSSQVPIDSIKIGNRFRKDLGDIALLAEDIKEIGLLHPIVINHKRELICGLRRIEAFKTLGKSVIPAHIINLNDIVKGEISENIQRKDFSWDEIIQIKKAVEPVIKKVSEMRMLSEMCYGQTTD